MSTAIKKPDAAFAAQTNAHAAAETPCGEAISDFCPCPAVIARCNFIHKSLANFSLNTAIGCCHGCGFCYVPSASARKQQPLLAKLGVDAAYFQLHTDSPLRNCWPDSAHA